MPSSYSLDLKFNLALTLLLAGALSSVSARPHNATHVTRVALAVRHTKTVPALTCSEKVAIECDPGSPDFCCADGAQCIDPADILHDAGDSKGGWGCELSCGAYEEPCMNGLTCCPENLQCTPDGQCVPKGPDDAAVQSPLVCDDGETLCNESCCMAEERCDAVKGICLAPDIFAPPPPAAAPPSMARPPASTTSPSDPTASTGANKNATAVTAHHRNGTGTESASSLVNAAPKPGIGSLAVLSSVFIVFSTAVVCAVRG